MENGFNLKNQVGFTFIRFPTTNITSTLFNLEIQIILWKYETRMVLGMK